MGKCSSPVKKVTLKGESGKCRSWKSKLWEEVRDEGEDEERRMKKKSR